MAGWEQSSFVGGGGKWSSKVKLPNSEVREPALAFLFCLWQSGAKQLWSEWDLAKAQTMHSALDSTDLHTSTSVLGSNHPCCSCSTLHVQIPPSTTASYVKKALRDGHDINILLYTHIYFYTHTYTHIYSSLGN